MDKHRDSIAVRRCLRGDRDAFAELVRRYTGLVFSVAVGCGLRPEDAEDATQDAFILAFRRLARLREPDSFRPWLCRIAVRQAQDVRNRRLREVPTDMTPLLADAVDPRPGYALFEREEDSRRIVGDALERLPDTLRLPFVMHEIGGASPVEVAEALSITRNAVDRRLNRAREHVRAHLRRCGLEADALDLLRSHAVTLTAGGELLSRVMGGLRGVSPEGATRGRTWGHEHVAASVLGLAAIVGSLGGMSAILPSPWGTLKTDPSSAVTTAGPAAMTVTMARGPRPQVRLLMRPGEELLGWQAVEPGRNAGVPIRAAGAAPGDAAGAVTANPYGIVKPVDATHGEITLSARIRVPPGPYNSQLGVTLDHRRVAQPLLWKDETDTWHYHDHEAEDAAVAIGPVEGRWRDVIIVYRTWAGDYDLYLDGRRIARRIVHGAWSAGVPVTGLYMTSGRGADGSPLHFSDILLSARDGASIRNARPGRPVAPRAARPSDRMALNAGYLAGQELDPLQPSVRVAPGASLDGWLDITLINRHGAAAAFHVIETPTWGDHEASFREVAGPWGPGETRRVHRVQRRAPLTPGTYRLVVAGAAETAPAYVAAGTNWPVGRPAWNDGTDIAGWSDDEIDQTHGVGSLSAPWTMEREGVGRVGVAVAAVEVVVVPPD